MARMKTEVLKEKLTNLGIEFDKDAKWPELNALLPKSETQQMPKREIIEIPRPVKPKHVPLGVGTINDHERRLDAIEEKLGIE